MGEWPGHFLQVKVVETFIQSFITFCCSTNLNLNTSNCLIFSRKLLGSGVEAGDRSARMSGHFHFIHLMINCETCAVLILCSTLLPLNHESMGFYGDGLKVSKDDAEGANLPSIFLTISIICSN